jgi:hypothetical protein
MTARPSRAGASLTLMKFLNASLRKGILRTQACQLDGYVNVYNLTNNEYEMPWQFQDPGASVTAGIKATF